MSFQDIAPIAAIATAPGRGGIGVVRISGQDLAPFCEKLFGRKLMVRHAHYLPFTDGEGQVIDQGIAIFFQAPHSYTGEDVLELQGHGGSAVLQTLLQRCLMVGRELGMRVAEPGEFSLRAFLNGKMDLAQAEAVADLINASSAAAAKAAMSSLTGKFSDVIHELIDRLVLLRTLVEATLDFPEEEIEFIQKYEVLQKLGDIFLKLEGVIETSRRSVPLRDGLKVVLAGEPNVGKSSLLNAIFEQEIAIVTEVAGTTRDRIRETLHLEGVPIVITDTAGLRDTNDPIEQIGIERTWAAIRESDLVLNVMDARHPHSVIDAVAESLHTGEIKTLAVFNKSDLIGSETKRDLETDRSAVVVSAKTLEGIDGLKEKILAAAGRQPGEISPWLGRERHILALQKAAHHLSEAKAHANLDDRVLDLLAEELRLAHQALGEITGQMTADELLGEIFSSFCIGK